MKHKKKEKNKKNNNSIPTNRVIISVVIIAKYCYFLLKSKRFEPKCKHFAPVVK
jgi:hypothetical protein